MQKLSKFAIVFMLIATMGFFTAITQPAQAIVPLIVAGYLAVALIGVAVGAVVSYYLTTHYQKLALINSVGVSYVTDTATEFQNLLAQGTQEYINEKSLMTSVYPYFMRKAEWASQYYVNETEFPTQKVLELSGLETEYENLVNGTKQHLINLNEVPEGYAEETFTGDLSDFTVSGLTQTLEAPQLDIQRTDLEGNDLSVKYGYVYAWNYAHMCPLTWTLGTGVSSAGVATDWGVFAFDGGFSGNRTMTSSTLTLPANTSLTFKARAQGRTGASDITLYLDVIDSSNSTIIKSGKSATFNDSEDLRTITVSDIDTIDRTVKLVIKADSLSGTVCDMGTITVTTDQTEPTYKDNTMMFYSTSDKGVVGYSFHNSTGTQATVQTGALYHAISEYLDTMKTGIRNALNAGEAYHTYLRGLGYHSYDEIETTIPSPSLLFPPTNATIWEGTTVGSMEWYAILASYMQSLYNLFQNATIGRQIGAVNFTQIQMVSLPVHSSGYLYAMNEPSNTSTPYLSSIWILPTVGNLTLVRHENVTLGVPCQVVYQENATNKIVYALYDADDIVYCETIWRRDQYGYEQSMNSVSIQPTTLDKYATNYITGYEGLDVETSSSWDLGLMMPLMMAILMISVLGGIFTRKRNKD